MEQKVDKKKTDKKVAFKIIIAVIALLLIPVIIASGYYVRKKNINIANKKEEAITETVVEVDENAPEAKTQEEDVIEPKKKEEAKAPVKDYPYELYVNATQNVVTVYKKDSNGKYTVPVRAMRCSTGKSGTPTREVSSKPSKNIFGRF